MNLLKLFPLCSGGILLLIILLTVLEVYASSTELSCSGKDGEVIRLLTLLPKGDLPTERGSNRDVNSNCDQSVGVSLALELAVEHINNMSSILPCQELRLIYEQTGRICEDTAETALALTHGLFSILKTTSNINNIVGVLGPMCSEMESNLVSYITNKEKLQLAVLLTAPLGVSSANHEKLSNTVSIIGGDSLSLAELSLSLLKESGWRNIAVLYEGTNLFYTTLNKRFITSIQNMRNQVNIRYASRITSNFYPLREVLSSKARIVFVIASLKHTRNVMCLAYHMNLVYPSYQWVLVGHHLSDLLRNNLTIDYRGKRFNCSLEMLSTVTLNEAFLLSYDWTGDNEETVKFANNLNKNEFLELYRIRVDEYNSKYQCSYSQNAPSPWAYVMYDAVWAWAVVLDRVLSNCTVSMSRQYDNYALHECRDKHWYKDILDEFYLVDFQGVSGHINFNHSVGGVAIVNRKTNIFLLKNGKQKHIAISTPVRGTVYLQNHIESIPDIQRIVRLPHSGIVYFFLTVQFLLLLIVVVLHSITLVFRKSKHIKASSSKLMQVVFLGGYIIILNVVLYIASMSKEYSPTEGAIICRVIWTWSLPIGVTMDMGIVILRTWRIHRIFKHYLNPGKFLSDSSLLVVLLLMVLVDVLLGIVWMSVDPMQYVISEYTPDKNAPVNVEYLEQGCSARYFYFWLSFAFAYKIILLTIMVALAFITMHIPNQTFSTRSLRIFVYLYCTVFIIGFSHYYFYRLFTSSDAHFIILCVVFNVLIVIFLTFVAIPPILPILRIRMQRLIKCSVKRHLNNK